MFKVNSERNKAKGDSIRRNEGDMVMDISVKSTNKYQVIETTQ